MNGIIDDRTANYSLPLPHPANCLADDVLRLRQSLNLLDQGLQNAADAALNASAHAEELENAWAVRFTEFSTQLVRLGTRLAELEAALAIQADSVQEEPRPARW